MKKFNQVTLILCGLLMLAAFPVFAQEESEPVKSVQINKEPLNVLGEYALAMLSPKNGYILEIRPFKVVLSGELSKKIIRVKDGQGKDKDLEIVAFDNNKTKWDAKAESGDKEMIELARSSVEAVGDSGFLGNLYNLGVKNVKIILIQGDEKFTLALESELPTPEKAKTLASGFGGLFSIAKLTAKGNDEKEILNSLLNPTTNDKTLILHAEMPKSVLQEIINRNLTKYKIKKLSEQ